MSKAAASNPEAIATQVRPHAAPRVNWRGCPPNSATRSCLPPLTRWKHVKPKSSRRTSKTANPSNMNPQVVGGTSSSALLKRLKTSSAGIKDMARQVRDVARLEDPLGRVLATTELDDGLTLQKVSCPLGVVAVIFESRPDVIPQVGSLAIKTGNGLVLKGGAEARQTNRVLVSIWHEALAAVSPSLREAICALTDRAEVARILEMDRDIDLVVPRGSTEFVNFVFERSRIPVLGHGSGICHIYVDAAADLDMARKLSSTPKFNIPRPAIPWRKFWCTRQLPRNFCRRWSTRCNRPALKSAAARAPPAASAARLFPQRNKTGTPNTAI